MLKRKLGLLVAAAVMVGMFTSCVNVIKTPEENGGEDPSGSPSGTEKTVEVDYTNYKDYSIKVKNESSKNVVCFYSSPRAENLISGAKANTTTGLKLNTSLFNDTTDFVLFVVSEDDYKANINNLSVLDNAPFARIYAYYNKDASNNNNVYTISKHLGGIYKLYLNNMTKYNVELRQDGLYGSALAYSAKQTIKTTINVDDGGGDYTLFPVFRKLDRQSGEILTNFPKTKNGNPKFFAFSLDNETTEYEIDASTFVAGDFTVTPSQAQLKINNQSTATGVGLYQGAGSTATLTSTGGKYVNPGKALTYPVEMDNLGKGVFESQRTIAGWRFGTEAAKFDIPSNVFKAGFRYVLNVTGDEYDDLTATFEKDSDGNIVAYEINFEEN